MESLKKYKKLLVFLPMLLWGISIPFRMYYVSDSPPVNNVAHVFLLQTMDIWKAEGPCASNFAMKHTYDNPGDKFITYYKRHMDNEGNNYYISHPSLSQMSIWLLSAGGKIPVNNLFLTWLALLSQLVTLYFLFYTVRMILRDKPYVHEASVLAMIIYLFHPVVLYLTTFHFFAESLGQMFFMICVYQLTKILKTENKVSLKSLFMLFVFGFLFAMSEWLALFFVFALFVLIVFCKKNRKTLLKPFVVYGTAVFAAMILYLVQHVQLADITTFVKALGIRYVERSGFFGNTYTDMGYSYLNPQSYLLLLKQMTELVKGTGVFFLCIFCAGIFKKQSSLLSSEQKTIMNVMLLSCGFYMLALFSATVTHYIYMAKWVIPMSILSVLVFFGFVTYIKNKTSKTIVFLLVLGSIIWSGFVFVKKASLLREPEPLVVVMADFIRENVQKDVSVFCAPMDGRQLTSVIWLSYTSQRNIAVAIDESSICGYMTSRPEKYVYLIPDSKSFEIREGVCLKKGE